MTGTPAAGVRIHAATDLAALWMPFEGAPLQEALATHTNIDQATNPHIAPSRLLSRRMLFFFSELASNQTDYSWYKPRWPCPRLSFARVRAHAPSTIGVAMIPVASTRKQAKSGAIITALGAIYGLTIVP